ncbi:hypothetical protein I6I32_01665 [Streptococcus oralis]|jgi:hypothetical protein|uniref:DUF5945 family protein n=1 Tax=Streptococcus oralis TaxID=1303 RepID=UPI0005B52BE9|nr:DUF5945 family protein [Streptococcus oralis]QQC00549.1 hypothetical protein I6I32_01665 [Streptococcus oralis]
MEIKHHFGIYGICYKHGCLLCIQKTSCPYKDRLDFPGGQLDTTEPKPTSAEQERAKIAALFGKEPEATAQDNTIDYSAAFEQHKKASQKTLDITSSEVTTPLPKVCHGDDLTAQYNAHLTNLLTGHEDELAHYRVELERLEDLITGKKKTITTIKAILTAIDTLV